MDDRRNPGSLRHVAGNGEAFRLGWSFSHSRDGGSLHIPERLTLREAVRFAPEALTHPRWLWAYLTTGKVPDLTVPNMTIGGGEAPTFFGADGQWMQTPPPTWDDVSWLREQWGGPFPLKGIYRPDEARRAVDAGVTAVPSPTTEATTSTAHPPPSAPSPRSSTR